jgi:hypothetical protein
MKTVNSIFRRIVLTCAGSVSDKYWRTGMTCLLHFRFWISLIKRAAQIRCSPKTWCTAVHYVAQVYWNTSQNLREILRNFLTLSSRPTSVCQHVRFHHSVLLLLTISFHCLWTSELVLWPFISQYKISRPSTSPEQPTAPSMFLCRFSRSHGTVLFF